MLVQKETQAAARTQASSPGSQPEAATYRYDEEGLVAYLKAHGVYTAARGGCVRVSPYLFNSAAEMRRLLALTTRYMRAHGAGCFAHEAAASERRPPHEDLPAPQPRPLHSRL